MPGKAIPDAPRVAVLEWTDPPFAPGHWVPEMVTRAGGLSVLGTAGARSVPVSWDDVAAADPDVVVVAPCGFDLTTSTALAEELLLSSPLAAMAARKGPDAEGSRGPLQVWAVDANASFARPGPRLVDGIEALAAIVDPASFGIPSASLAKRLR